MQGSRPSAGAMLHGPARQKKRRPLLIYLAIICLSFGAYALLAYATTNGETDLAQAPLRSPALPSQLAKVKVDPATQNVDLGVTFDIDVAIEDARDLGSFEFELTYDSTCIQATNVALGPFLESTGRAVTTVGPTFGTGSVTYGAFSLPPPAEGPNGDGVLATITFQAGTGTCSSALHLQNVIATDTTASPLDLSTEDGEVTVGPPPLLSVTGINPNSGYIGDVLEDVIVIGENFEDGASVQLTKSGQNPISASWVEVQSSTQISCTLNLGKAVAGQWDVVVTNPDSLSGTLDNGFTVYGQMTITGITPSSGHNDEIVHITNLAGTNFRTAVTVKLVKSGEADIDATNVQVVSTTQITCDLDLRGASPGQWTVRLAAGGGQPVELQNGFTVQGVVYLPTVLKNR
jgi:hypothetical protein